MCAIIKSQERFFCLCKIIIIFGGMFMSQKSLTIWMKVIIALFGICGAVVYALIIPAIGLEMVNTYPEYSYGFLPWLIFLLLTAIPCYAVLAFAWKIATSIGFDKAFSSANSKRLKRISLLSAGTSLYFFIGNAVFLLFNLTHFSIFLAACFIAFIGAAISVAAAVLSYLVQKTVLLQEQSDLTI